LRRKLLQKKHVVMAEKSEGMMWALVTMAGFIAKDCMGYTALQE